MSSDPKTYAGPYPTPESQGIDKGYEAVRDQAKAELAGTMAGPEKPLQQISGEDIKNPEGEFAIPAPRTGSPNQEQRAPGPNQAGNSAGDGSIDPQGQQGGTEGGQPGSPSLELPDRTGGTPLADGDERERQSRQRKGAGVDTGI
jgi:hypothetical protein